MPAQKATPKLLTFAVVRKRKVSSLQLMLLLNVSALLAVGCFAVDVMSGVCYAFIATNVASCRLFTLSLLPTLLAVGCYAVDVMSGVCYTFIATNVASCRLLCCGCDEWCVLRLHCYQHC